MERIRGISELSHRFDGLILDLWGVVHDGVRPYPGAVECLTGLRGEGKKVVMLSNAPRRAAFAQSAMREMGIPDDLYAGIVTSGEAVHGALLTRPDGWWAGLGRRVFHLGPERDRNVIAGLDLVTADIPAEAEFVLNTGPDDHADPTDLAEFEAILGACADASLPMICANPDLEVIRGGVRVLCAGALAVRYQELGGDVRSLGKPDPEIYRLVMGLLDLPLHRVLAVGDSLRTDIAGAAAIGVASCWVLGGLHGEALLGDPGRAEREASAYGLAPVACVPSFVWS